MENNIEIILMFSDYHFFKNTFPVDSVEEAMEIAKKIILNCNQYLNYIAIKKGEEEVARVKTLVHKTDLKMPD